MDWTAGELCALTTSKSSDVTTACKAPTGGTGPISTSCIPGPTGKGTISRKAGGTTAECSIPVP